MSLASETFALPDARCAGCVLKIERALSVLPGVREARGNATQKRVRVIWDEAAQSTQSLRMAICDLGYTADRLRAEGTEDRLKPLLRRLGVAGFGMMNIMAFSFSVWFGIATDMGAGTMQFLHWLSGAIALPVMAYSGSVFHGPALRAMRQGRMTMDTPISIAILVTFLASLVETLRGAEHVYFDAVVSLIFFLLIGRVLEQILHRRSTDAATNLREYLDVQAERILPGGARESVGVAALRPGDRILVKAGGRVPADGVLTHGSAQIDESALTGEATPRLARVASRIAAGSTLVTGPVEIRVTHVGRDSEIGKMAEMAEDVVAHKGQLQRLSDQFARGYIPLVLGGGMLGFLFWHIILGASLGQSVLIAVAVLIVTCPCAAGLATPAVTSRAMSLALSGGVIVKTGSALERLGAVDTVFLDKTGTASTPALRFPDDMKAEDRSAALALAAASSHPMARALLADGPVPAEEGAREIAGQGVLGRDGARLGSAQFVSAQSETGPALWFRSASGDLAPIALKEEQRTGLRQFLAAMQARGLPVSLVSGDTKSNVARFAQDAGIAHWSGARSPEDKLAQVQAVQAAGGSVLMVGDGINDTVALTGADLSASFAEATEIAQNAADIVLTQPNLARLGQTLTMASRARALIQQNLVFSMLYNIVTVPLALAGVLTPAIAALLMSASSLVVMANGLRLKGPA